MDSRSNWKCTEPQCDMKKKSAEFSVIFVQSPNRDAFLHFTLSEQVAATAV